MKMISRAKFVFSKSKIIDEYQKLSRLTDILCYSIKSNPYITSILEKKTKSEFLMHHLNELMFVDDSKKIWFMLHSPEKQEIDVLLEKGVDKFIVDNRNDLNFLLDYLKDKQSKITLLIRMRIKEYTVQTGRYFVFGMYSSDINELIPELKKNKNIAKLGIHFHRKTQNISEWSMIMELEESLSEEVWKKIDFLDIGGGIPVSYKNISSSVIDDVYRKVKEAKEYLNKRKIKLIIEPGRAIAAPSGRLVTTIKNIVDNTIFIDASVFNSAMDTIVSHIKLLVDGENEEEKGEAYVIKGLTPASEDIFRYRVYLKKSPKIGDKIIFLNAGAYIYYTDLFNLERPEIEIVE